MWRLLILLALWLGTEGVGGLELTAVQRKGLQVALEEFHRHPPVQWAFQETSVDSAMDTPFPAGTFVRLEFRLQQTGCRKKDWKKPECKVKPNGRKRKCLACIKLDPAHKVLGRMVHCPLETQGQELQEPPCSKVQRAGEDPHSFYFPGQFAFSRALPPS
ncbi:retinoic acid receptor responder protein 2 [Octodon degus]|uniref:Retinoic acid receptor responder protein 2 n=1 Tax=Octodon degus TaxID=10160 RepID=A0A6P6E8D4_OCTDE|nr:retinoic acid receptor responder protein 2 [Octodon degus]XP_023568591.1 retinoic acid receptor responder protein 2 [Octodon degus]XP_023568592.1 retinoic acid receptor responder protein 2 [Octodon degus]